MIYFLGEVISDRKEESQKVKKNRKKEEHYVRKKNE